MFVTSFTFQAPGFYERHGYREIFRWDDVPVAGPATCTSARTSELRPGGPFVPVRS